MANTPFRLVARSTPLLTDTVKRIPQSIAFSIAELEVCNFALPSPLPNHTAVILTSANVVPLLPSSVPIIVVNETSKVRAQERGLNVVLCGQGNAHDLAKNIVSAQLPYTHYIHLHGDTATIGWHKILTQAGYIIDTRIIYKTLYTEHISPNILQLLKNQAIREIFLFSPKGAQHCKKLFKQYNVPTNTMTAYCLSEAIAAEWGHANRIKIAKKPTLLALIDQIESTPLS